MIEIVQAVAPCCVAYDLKVIAMNIGTKNINVITDLTRDRLKTALVGVNATSIRKATAKILERHSPSIARKSDMLRTEYHFHT